MKRRPPVPKVWMTALESLGLTLDSANSQMPPSTSMSWSSRSDERGWKRPSAGLALRTMMPPQPSIRWMTVSGWTESRCPDERIIGRSSSNGNGSFGISTAKLEANASAMVSDAQTPSLNASAGMATGVEQEFFPPMISSIVGVFIVWVVFWIFWMFWMFWKVCKFQ